MINHLAEVLKGGRERKGKLTHSKEDANINDLLEMINHNCVAQTVIDSRNAFRLASPFIVITAPKPSATPTDHSKQQHTPTTHRHKLGNYSQVQCATSSQPECTRQHALEH